LQETVNFIEEDIQSSSGEFCPKLLFLVYFLWEKLYIKVL